MSPVFKKRGRPLSQSSGDADQDRKREQARERKRRERERKAEAKNRKPTDLQLIQSERVIQQTIIPDVTPTPQELGLRIQDLTLDYDDHEPQVQKQVQPVNQHSELYSLPDYARLSSILERLQKSAYTSPRPSEHRDSFSSEDSSSATPRSRQQERQQLRRTSPQHIDRGEDGGITFHDDNEDDESNELGDHDWNVSPTNQREKPRVFPRPRGDEESSQNDDQDSQDENRDDNDVLNEENDTENAQDNEDDEDNESPEPAVQEKRSQDRGIHGKKPRFDPNPSTPEPHHDLPKEDWAGFSPMTATSDTTQQPSQHSPLARRPRNPDTPNDDAQVDSHSPSHTDTDLSYVPEASSERQESLDASTQSHSAEQDDFDIWSEDNSPSELEEADPIITISAKIRQQLQNPFGGCTLQEHDSAQLKHIHRVEQDNSVCKGLDETFQDATFPTTIQQPNLLRPEALSRLYSPSPEQWQAKFCGVEGASLPNYVCLHATQSGSVYVEEAYDVDSYLGFASSLGFARQGIDLQMAPQYRQNIQHDVHIHVDIQRDDGREYTPTDETTKPSTIPTQLRDVPHYRMGRMRGEDAVSIYILFPEIGVRGTKFSSLSAEMHRRWMDVILLPTLRELLPYHFVQHFPGSFDHAMRNSYAQHIETRTTSSSSYSTQQATSYFLPPTKLVELWDQILNRIEQTPEAKIFRNAQIFFSAKGTKLHYKPIQGRHTLLDTLESFLQSFERYFVTEYVYPDRVFIDIGREICPTKSAVRRRDGRVKIQEPHVLLWKRCCLDTTMHHLWDDKPPSKMGSGRQFYSMSMLYDAANLTSIPGKKSHFSRGGVAYKQFYNSVKEVVDAAKTYPFQNEGAEEMALDPAIRRAAQSTGRSSKRQAHIIENAYLASKSRFTTAVKSSMAKSFGVREEYRCALRLIHRIVTDLRDEIREQRHNDDYPIRVKAPSSVWAIPTRTYLNFLYRNADKFATGFEIVRARARSEAETTTWEQTKMMAMFLRCLRFCLAGHNLSRESALWWGLHEKQDTGTGRVIRRVGLGMSHTLSRYGYCWIEPRVDWTALTFHEDITDDVLFGNGKLRQTYIRQGAQVSDFFDSSRQIALALRYFKQLQHIPSATAQVLQWLVHITLRQFRADVIESIKDDLSEEFLDRHALKELKKGQHPFSFEYIDSICQPGKIRTPRRQNTKFKNPKDLVRHLVWKDDEYRREHWGNKAFRALYWQCRDGLGTQYEQVFHREFENHLVRWHWVLPYPHPKGLTKVNKESQRIWYAIDVKHTMSQMPFEKTNIEDWVMLNETHRPGLPEDLPDFVHWDHEQWQEWRRAYGE